MKFCGIKALGNDKWNLVARNVRPWRDDCCEGFCGEGKRWGEGTPAKNSAFDTDADNWLFGNPEDPQGNSGINSHYHIRHLNDMVWKVADAAGDKSDPYYSNEPTTTNWDIPNTGIKLNGPIESHTDLPSHPKFETALKQLPKMPAAPAAGKLEEKK